MTIKLQNVQSLRGIAVMAVILFHLEPDLFAGGFIGVDLFLFVSGYVLFPSLNKIFNSTTTQSFHQNSAVFLSRRLKRLFPSFFTFAVFSVPFVLFLVPVGKDMSLAFRQLISAFFLSANWSAAEVASDYFSHYPNVFLHLWSLSYEEQVYLFILALLFVLYLSKIRRHYGILLIAFVLLILSLMSGYPDNSYYSFTFRLWEFGLGLMVAYTTSKTKFRFESSILLLLFLYISIFALMIIELENNLIFRLFLVLGSSCLVLLSTDHTGGYTFFLAEVGNRSYSLYLFHYPLVVYAKSYIYYPEPIRNIVVILSLISSLLVAELIYRKVEVRVLNETFWVNGNKELSIRYWVTSTSVILVVICATLWASNQHNFFGFNKHDVAPIFTKVFDGCDITNAWKAPCVYGRGSKSIALVGDSHASALAPVFVDLAKKENIVVYIYSYKGCKYIDANLLTPSNAKLLDPKCEYRNNKIYQALKSNKHDKVFFAFRAQDCSFNNFIDLCGSKLTDLIIESLRLESEAVLFTPVPEFTDIDLFHPRRLLDPYTQPSFTFPKSAIVNQVNLDSVSIKFQLPRNHIDVSDRLCNSQVCFRNRFNSWLWVDSNHLSKFGANLFYKTIKSTLI